MAEIFSAIPVALKYDRLIEHFYFNLSSRKSQFSTILVCPFASFRLLNQLANFFPASKEYNAINPHL